MGSKQGTWYSEWVTLQYVCVSSWAGVTHLRNTMLMSPETKDGTAVLPRPRATPPLPPQILKHAVVCFVSLLTVLLVSAVEPY